MYIYRYIYRYINSETICGGYSCFGTLKYLIRPSLQKVSY